MEQYDKIRFLINHLFHYTVLYSAFYRPTNTDLSGENENKAKRGPKSRFSDGKMDKIAGRGCFKTKIWMEEKEFQEK